MYTEATAMRCTLLILALVTLAADIALVIAKRQTQHFMTAALVADTTESVSLQRAGYDADFALYLATLTIGLIGAVLASLQHARKLGVPCDPAFVSLLAFALGMMLMTLGYAAKDHWVITGKALPSWFTTLDAIVSGTTASCYVYGSVALALFLAKLAWASTKASPQPSADL